MGLPHVLVRFYTNPDGRAARRTTLVVLALLGAFYLLPAVYGALGRLYAPDLAASGRADAVVLLLPAADGRRAAAATCSTALVTAGAFAAFLSTSSGLTISVAGVHRPGRAAQAAGGRHGSGAAPSLRGRGAAACSRSLRAATLAGRPTWSGWPSRWPPRRSARCWCSASGGAG